MEVIIELAKSLQTSSAACSSDFIFIYFQFLRSVSVQFGDVQLAAWRTHRLSLENVLRLSLWHYWYPNVLWRVSNMVLASKLQIFGGRF